MLCMYSGWNIDGYFDLRVTFSIYPQWCDKRRFPLKAERKVKPTEPLWAVKCEHVRVWARRRTSVCVSQSIRLTDALDPLGLRRGAEARQLTWVVRGASFRGMQTSKTRVLVFAWNVVRCKTRTLRTCLQLLTAVVRYSRRHVYL